MAYRRPLRSALPTLLLASALGLTACGGSADAGGSPSAGASASSTPTPPVDTRPTPASSSGPARNLAKPELPAAAKENTEAGFEAFTQHWLDAATYAYETGDTAPLMAVSETNCSVCGSLKKTVESIYERNGWSVGPKWVASDFHSNMKTDPEGRVEGFYLVMESPNQRFDASGIISKNLKGTPVPAGQVIYATYRNGSWKTAETGNVK